MSTCVLIHGAAHGGWCWYKVVAALEKHGHTALAPDLPGHGKDKTPVAAVTAPVATPTRSEKRLSTQWETLSRALESPKHA